MICFTWSGFPQYAARCVGAFAQATDEKVVVVATRPAVPIKGMEKCCGCEVKWIDAEGSPDVRSLCGEMPRAIVVNGWSTPSFNALRDQVRSAGGHVIVSVDNDFPGYLFRPIQLRAVIRLVLKAIRFRLLLRRYYDGYLVPGKSGVRLLRFFGVPREKIEIGMYAADASLFKAAIPICERPKRVIYVGQICERKNVRRLVAAFAALSPRFPDWSLDLYGSGPLADEINQTIQQASNPTIHLHPFAQPEALASLYTQSRIFILPSLEEHWGLVVHEAALSGCVILTSRQVGSSADFVTPENGHIFDAFDDTEMRDALSAAMSSTDDQFQLAERVSRRLSANASLPRFVSALKKLGVD